MNTKTKATLLSAMVFPGAGQIYLKQYILGSTFILISLVSLFFIIQAVIFAANTISQDILAGNIPLDLFAIRTAVSDTLSLFNTPKLIIAKIIIVICWGLSMILAYFFGSSKKPSTT